MKKNKELIIIPILLILLVFRYMVHTMQVANIVISLLGISTTILYMIFFYDIDVPYKRLILFAIAFEGLITTAINASSIISDLVLMGVFMYVVILSKIMYLIAMFSILDNINKKYIPFALLFVAVAVLSFIEIMGNIQALISIIALIYYLIIRISERRKK